MNPSQPVKKIPERGFFSWSSRQNLKTYRTVAATAFLGIILTAAIAFWFWAEAHRLDQARFEDRCRAAVGGVDLYTHKIANFLENLARELSRQEGADQIAWDDFLEQTSAQWNFVGLAAVGYATNQHAATLRETYGGWLNPENRRSREELFKPHPPETNFWTTTLLNVYRGSCALAVPAVARTNVYATAGRRLLRTAYSGLKGPPSFQSPQFFLWGQHGSLEFHEDRLTQVADSVLRNEPKFQIEALPTLRQTGAHRSQITMIVPVPHPIRRELWAFVRPHDVPFRAEEKWMNWIVNQGLVFGVVDLAAIWSDLLGNDHPELSVECYAWDDLPFVAISEATWVNRSAKKRLAETIGVKPAFAKTMTVPMYGKEWRLFFHGTAAFERQSTRYRAIIACVLGLFLTALTCVVVWIQIRVQRFQSLAAAESREARDAFEAAQQERESLSRDLHDGTIQSLYAIQLGLTETASKVRHLMPDASTVLAQSQRALDEVIAEIRTFLRPDFQTTRAIASRIALPGVLSAILQRFRTGSRARLECEFAPNPFPDVDLAYSVELANIARESLSNSLRHGDPSWGRLRLSLNDQKLVLEIHDDGTGFQPDEIPSHGLGLATMRQRAEKIGAKLEILSAPAKGTLVRVSLCLP